MGGRVYLVSTINQYCILTVVLNVYGLNYKYFQYTDDIKMDFIVIDGDNIDTFVITSIELITVPPQSVMSNQSCIPHVITQLPSTKKVNNDGNK